LRKQLTEHIRRRGSPVLMWILVVEILCSPLADTHPRIGAVLALVVLSSVLAGASLTGNRRIVLLVGIPLSGIWMIARLLEEFGDGRHPYDHMAHVVGLALSCTLLWALFDRIHTAPQVTSSVLAEAAIVYLIIAIAFSQLYWILAEFIEHPFNQSIPPSDGTAFLYFSMITLTSLGYGGIFPVNPFVRLIAAFESMIGILFIAVIVARLVSSYGPPSKPPQSSV
jgi:hypothetical protein